MDGVDAKRIIAEVAARHGVRLDADDPLVVALTANEVVLARVAEQLVAEVRRATAELRSAAGAVPAGASAVLLEASRQAAATIRRDLERDVQGAGLKARAIVDAVHRAHSRPVVLQWVVAGLVVAVMIFGVGVAVGQMVR